MILHNYYTVRANGQTQVAYNDVVTSPAVSGASRYARYIALLSGGAVVAVFPAELSEINADPTAGELRATYSVLIEEAGALSFDAISLSPNADGSGAVSTAECEKVTYDGKPTEISVTVFCDVSGDETCLGGGDNIIARWLLGSGDLPLSGYTLATGKCMYGNRPITRGDDQLWQTVDATVSAEADGIHFRGSVGGQKHEFMILYDGKCVLRSKQNYTSSASTSTNVATYFNSVTFATDVVGVSSVTLDGKPISYDLVRSRGDTLIKVPLNFPKLGILSAIKSDPRDEYLGAFTQTELILLKVEGFETKIVSRMPLHGEYVEICERGALAFWDENKLTIYEPDGSGYTEQVIELKCEPKRGKAAVVREPSGYHICRIYDGYVERYSYIGGTLTLIARFEAGLHQFVTQSYRNIGWVGGDGAPMGAASLTGELNNFAANVQKTIDSYGGQVGEPVFDDDVCVATYANGRKAGVLYGGTIYYFASDTATFITGGHAMITVFEGTQRIYVIDRISGSCKQVGGNLDASEKEITGVAIAGERLFILYKDGTLDQYYVDFYVYTLWSQQIVRGNRLTCTVLRRNVPNSAVATQVAVDFVIS